MLIQEDQGPKASVENRVSQVSSTMFGLSKSTSCLDRVCDSYDAHSRLSFCL